MSKRTYITSLTAINNSNIVTVNDGTDLSNINPGDDLRIDGLPGEAVKAITATQIILERPWALANKTNVKGINVPTADDFREATKLLRDATVLTASNMSAVNDWTTQMGTVEFTDPAEPTVTYTVKTIRQLEQDAIVIIGSAVEDADRAEAARDAAIAAQNQAETHKNTAGVSAGTAAAKASEAATSASTATTAATTATTKAAEAVVSASNALAEANRAEVEANKAAIAASALYAMTEAQFEANRAQNRQLFAASGYESFGKHISGGYWKEVNQGIWVSGTESSKTIRLGTKTSNAIGFSKTEFPTLHIAGVIFSDVLFNEGVGQPWSNVKFPQAPDGKTTYNKSTGVITTHTAATDAFNAQAADQTNIEVVINRVDMWGFEAFLEEVNTTNPYVYPNGLIQSQAATMDEIATSASARPVTYYAVFDGDTGSKGKGVNFFALTDAQKKKVLGNHKNNLYYLDDGRLVQWRLRQRTIAGAGNGDWANVDANYPLNIGAGRLRLQPLVDAKMQGALDAASTDLNLIYSGFYETNQNNMRQQGVFSGRKDYTSTTTLGGEIYFLVCGTVNRLNQGAYHPSFNPSGTDLIGDNAGNTAAGRLWHESRALIITSVSDAFSKAGSLSGSRWGTIGSTISGRPDGRFHDAIYANGQGGVCRDMRYSAYGKTLEDFAEADQRVKNGTYRGFEQLRFTKVFASIAAATSAGYIVQDSTDASAVVAYKLLTYSIGGSFLQTDVIGSPINILATPQLANGWQGSWGGLSGGGGVLKTGTRKMIASGLLTYSSNNGATWNTGQLPQPNAENEVTRTYSESEIRICQYQAFAKQTENAVNTPVYGGDVGVGSVATVRINEIQEGSLLQESLIGKVNTDTTAWVTAVNLVSNGLRTNGAFSTYTPYYPVHPNLMFESYPPANNSLAVKALDYNVNINQQAFIQYAYTELRHNGTNWGDDGKVTIVDNQSTKTDLNGNTVLVGTAKLKEPIGWLRIKV